MLITAKIDCTKIDKSRLFQGKNGAQYLDFVLVETPDSKYGNSHMIVQSVSREEKANGIRGAILGNAKYAGNSQAAQRNHPTDEQLTNRTPGPAADLPF